MILLTALMLLLSAGFEQTEPNDGFEPFPTSGISAMRDLGTGKTKLSVPAIAIPDTLFFLSPGDQLLLRWWGIGKGSEQLVVDTRRELVLPDIGRINVERISLRQVRDTVQAIYEKRVRARLVDLQVIHVSQARVTVIGFSPRIGSMSVPSGTPASEVLSLAGINVGESLVRTTVPSGALERRNKPLSSLRGVVLRRSGGDSSRLDLARAINLGSKSDDPPLFSGDELILFPRGRVVLISGNVPRSGEFETVGGESIGEFLTAAGATRLPSKVEVSLQSGALRQVSTSDPLDDNMEMIHVPWSDPEIRPGVVWVMGEVSRPGPVPAGLASTVSHALHAAGGLAISEDSAIMVPVKSGWPAITAPRTPRSADVMQIPEVRLALQGHGVRMKGNYSGSDPELHPGDTVWVYRAEQVVWVGGAVRRPGFVSWRKGADMQDYVGQAGGFGTRASKGKIVAFDLYTDQQIDRGQEIRPGAAVIVPEKKYIDPLTWLAAVGTIVSLFVTAGTFYITATQQ